jgi:hypothetical protein
MEEDGEWCGVKEEDRVLLVFLFLFNLNHWNYIYHMSHIQLVNRTKWRITHWRRSELRFVMEVYVMIHSSLSCSLLSVKNSIFLLKKGLYLNRAF